MAAALWRLNPDDAFADACGPRCLALVALIRAPAVIGRILEHLGLPTTVPTMRLAREPPLPSGGDAHLRLH
jgi:hypothetical protein